MATSKLFLGIITYLFSIDFCPWVSAFYHSSYFDSLGDHFHAHNFNFLLDAGNSWIHFFYLPSLHQTSVILSYCLRANYLWMPYKYFTLSRFKMELIFFPYLWRLHISVKSATINQFISENHPCPLSSSCSQLVQPCSLSIKIQSGDRTHAVIWNEKTI